MNISQMLPIIIGVVLIVIAVKSKIVKIIGTIILIVLVLSVLSYLGVLPINFNIIAMIKEWFGAGKAEGIDRGVIEYVISK